MGLFGQTFVLYLVIGIGVAGAVFLADRSTPNRWFEIASAVPFWPLYLPILLAPKKPDRRSAPVTSAHDELAIAIAQVDAELDAALGNLDGLAEDVLARETLRIRDLRSAWLAQAERIREMDRILRLPEFADETVPLVGDDRLRGSRQARQQNVERLRRLRQRAHDDLAASLTWVRELVSMIHLAKFNGSPAARTRELVAQIAAAVEGLSELGDIEEPEMSSCNAIVSQVADVSIPR